MDLRNFTSVKERRKAFVKASKVDLSSIGSSILSDTLASSKNCENMIGFTQVPLGIAGPLRIKDLKIGEYYIPLATTEGALVASINRGCKVITQNGGAQVLAEKVGITRAPVFALENIIKGKEFIKWVEDNFVKIKEECNKTSSHLSLLDIKSWMMHRNVFLRFRFDTQDAMGMNMATIATSSAVSYIEKKTGIKCLSLSGNMCVDKKPNFLNFIMGRGIKAWADLEINKKTLENTLKTNANDFFITAQAKLINGSILSGSIGSNSQAANIIAAIFLATGQDMAHVVDSSICITNVEKNNENIYISVFLPSLIIGTVGGGTNLATQKEALAILGISGGDNGNNSQKFAKIIACSVLAGEISLLASLAQGTLAKSHQRLSRGEKV